MAVPAGLIVGSVARARVSTGSIVAVFVIVVFDIARSLFYAGSLSGGSLLR